MIRMASQAEASVLQRIIQLLQNRVLDPGEAWSCFSSPREQYTFGRKNKMPPVVVDFTEPECDALESLKEKVKRRLERESGKRCVYCRRVMGNYHYSWQIEHIMSKSQPPYLDLVFDMDNLALACIDCNYAKGAKVDRIKRYVFDIIHPKRAGFRYGDHLRFLHVATEDICVLKYQRISPEGINTYTKLKLHVWERAETLKSISASHAHLVDQLDRVIGKYNGREDTVRIAQFMHKLKVDLLSTRQR